MSIDKAPDEPEISVPAEDVSEDAIAPTILRRTRLVPRGEDAEFVVIGHAHRRFGDLYVRLLAASWTQLAGFSTLFYLTANLLFAASYLLLGDGIAHARRGSFADAFFFSVQTMATIGYGNMSPNGVVANLLVTVEALFGFGFFAIVTGLLFSKFSRPSARVAFSETAVIGPYDGKPHLMLRLANERGNRIVDARIHLVVLLNEETMEGSLMRRFHDLHLKRSKVPLMQLTWTAQHAIDADSPLYGLSQRELRRRDAEIIVSLTGLDETLSQTIHARYSYIADEIAFNALFEDVLIRNEAGVMQVHYDKFHQVRKL